MAKKSIDLSTLTVGGKSKTVRTKTRVKEELAIEPEKKKKKKKKVKSLEDEVVKKKKKKKKESTSLSVAEKRTKKHKKLKQSASVHASQLETLIQNNPQIKEHDQFQEYVYIFESLQGIARIKEEQCLDKDKGAQSKDIYALMQVYNQMRDVIADIRALRDISQVADQFGTDVLEPFAQTTASILMDFYQSVDQLARKSLTNEQIGAFTNALKIYTKASGISLQAAYEVSRNKTLEVLSDQ